ncbi:MAG: sigma-54 dependent transcriptional regulator [Candidatus Muirbacterium halophilum]|nr:sigma-54 dependent transcriptional regulator [Candidatus Muirbacterium halophilum]MCK9475379.1 sigma-54 dependent transcriptional regulator [Candidatus Muirbacterium halophilum]
MNEKILILEDEADVLFRLSKELSDEFEVETCLSIKDFDKTLQSFEPEIAVMDIRLPDGSSMEYLKEKKLYNKGISVILISGYPEEEYLIDGIRLKISDFIKKPFRPVELKYAIRKIINEKNTKSANRILSSKSDNKLVFKSECMNNILEKATKYAQTDEPVLITGESGTGKQLIASFIHSQSNRANTIFLDINCASISETLLESQLFGHKKGAFTDAKEDFKGFFELTSEGTLFLDEISEMKPELQAKLLKVVENKSFIPLGGNRPVSVDSRIITATNRNIEDYIKNCKFRHDLYYRLNVFRIEIPPLRERKEDISILCEYFIKESNLRLNKDIKKISDEVIDKYINYNWPGNIRELKNVIHRAVLLSEDNIIKKTFLNIEEDNDKKNVFISDSGILLDDIVKKIEIEYITKAMVKTGGSQSKAARLLGITRDMLRYRIKNYNINI